MVYLMNRPLPQRGPHAYVICQECGRRFQSVEYSHLHWKHGMSIEEYEKRYPDHPRVSTATLIRLGRLREATEQLDKY